MNSEKQEVIDMFATKYGNENRKSQDILKNSFSRLLSKKQMDSATLQQLRKSLSRSQTESAFFPKIEESRDSSRGLKKVEPAIQNTTLRSSGQQFTKRLIPFQKTFLNQQSEKISEESEESKKSIYLVDRHDEDEWAALIKFDAQLFLKEQQQKKELAKIKKKRLKEELDKQLIRKEEQKKLEKVGENNYHSFQTNLLEQQLEREKQKIEQDRKRIKQLQSERDRQVKVLKKQKINQDRDNKIYKQQLNQRYEADFKQQQDNDQRNKQSKKDYMFRVMKQSELDKQSILDKEKELQKQEFEQLNKYGQFLDQIEQKKNEAQKIRWEKVNKNNAWSEAQVAKYKQIEEDDYQFNQYKQMEEKRIQEELIQKKQKYNQQKIKTIQTLEQQIEIKQQKTLQEKQLDKAQGRFWKEDTEKYIQDEQEKQRKIREAHIYHKYQLDQQIQDKKKPERGDKMTVLELLQNKKQLKTIKEQDIYEIEKIVV